ncbi:MAG: transglycosylase domain-containing protein [Gemmatimonadota bacterium]
MKRGKMLGGKAPRRGGHLTRVKGERTPISGSPQVLGVLASGCIIIGMVAGFAIALDGQIRAGILEQRATAMQRPDWTGLSDMPDYVPPAFLATVDPGFLEGGALRTREQRATTIPRELVRQIHLLGESLTGEARELVMAPLLEQRMSKEQILELYLNRVYLGESRGYEVFGIHFAAQEYFGKVPEELTLGEAATLAGLLLDPRIDHPQESPGGVGIRRNEVLRTLLRAGDINQEAYSAALTERLAFQPGLEEMPMTRRIFTEADTAVIRLPSVSLTEEEPEGSD